MRAVNLLPAERRRGAERSKPKLTPLHGMGLAILVGGAALGYWGHGINGQVTEQKAAAADLDAQAQALTTQISALKATSKTPGVSSYETDVALVTGLTAARVNWSTVMINLSRVAPGSVWLESLAVTTPSAEAAAATGAGAQPQRPAAITLTAKSTSRTEAALFISRLDAIPGFDGPRLKGGINPVDSENSTGPTTYSFSVDIPVDDGLFGASRPAAATQTASQSATTPATATPTNP